MTALEQLLTKIEHGHRAGLIPADWWRLARAARAERQHDWLPEVTFRKRKGKGVDWCRNHFVEFERAGMAKMNETGKRREWRADCWPDVPKDDVEKMALELAS